MEWKSIITTIVTAIVILILGYFWTDVPVLKSQVCDLRAQVKDLNSQVTSLKSQQGRIEDFLSFKYPNYNFKALAEISAVKKITPNAFHNIIFALEKNPQNAKTYLMGQFGFTASEAKYVLSPPVFIPLKTTNSPTGNPGPGIEH